jgi:methyl-accepting chemotaxis protein
MSIKTRLTLGIFLGQTVFLLLLLLVFSYQLNKTNVDQLQDRVNHAVAVFAVSAKHYIIENNYIELNNIARKLMGASSDQKHFCLVDANDMCVVSINCSSDLTDYTEENSVRSEAVIQENGKYYGKIIIYYDLNAFKEVLSTAKTQFIILSLVGLIGATLFAYTIGANLSKGLTELQDAVFEVSDNAQSLAPLCNDHDELGRLACSFNQIVHNLRVEYGRSK